MTRARGRPQPRCPIRPGDPCSLCQPGVTGPEDCGLVYLVRSDPDLRDRLHELTNPIRRRVGHGLGRTW